MVPAILEVDVRLLEDKKLDDRGMALSLTRSQVQRGSPVVVLHIRGNSLPQHLIKSHSIPSWCKAQKVAYHSELGSDGVSCALQKMKEG